jgi:hypothetical protein
MLENTGEMIFEVWCHGEHFRVSSWEGQAPVNNRKKIK